MQGLNKDVLSIIHMFRKEFEMCEIEIQLKIAHMSEFGRLTDDYVYDVYSARRLIQFGIYPSAQHFLVLDELFHAF
jgi:hypothetical protein